MIRNGIMSNYKNLSSEESHSGLSAENPEWNFETMYSFSKIIIE